MARPDLPAAAMATEIADLCRQRNAIDTMFPGCAGMPKEERDQHDDLSGRMCDLADEIVEAPVHTFSDALSVLLAANSSLLTALDDQRCDLVGGMPIALAVRRATDFLASYMGTDLNALGAGYLREGDCLWSRGRGLRADWWVERALNSGFAFNLRCDATMVICAPVGTDVSELCDELTQLDRDGLTRHIRFLIAEQRNPARCNVQALAGEDWWLTSKAALERTRADLRVVCGDLPA